MCCVCSSFRPCFGSFVLYLLRVVCVPCFCRFVILVASLFRFVGRYFCVVFCSLVGLLGSFFIFFCRSCVLSFVSCLCLFVLFVFVFVLSVVLSLLL